MGLPVVTNPNPTTNSGSLTKLLVKAGASPTTQIVPLASDINIDFSEATETIPYYAEGGPSITVKTGLDGTGTIETIGPSDNPVIAELVAAGFAVGPGAELYAIMSLSEGSYIYGIIVINKAVPRTPVRGASRWSFPFRTTGPVKFQAIGV
jgi:hypothetical protein